MKEIEAKVLEINKEEIITKLESLHAKKILNNAFIEDCLFDFANNDIKKKKELLRVRKINQDCYLTYKKNLIMTNISKTEDEFETKVKDAETIKTILMHLGFKITQMRQKYRTSYMLEDTRIEIDSLPDIPTYIELESPSEEKIKQTLQKLNIPLEKALPITGGDVIRKYGKDPKNLLFS